jgi:thiamine-monophosphate kinase
VEDVHFRRAWLTWEEIGWRSVAAALSDLAAMGAAPIGALMAVGLAPELGSEVAESLASGVGKCLRRFSCPLIGGDISGSPGPAVIDVTVLGSCLRPLSRAGAAPGNGLWVTGRLGGAAFAASSWQRGREPDDLARAAFAHPIPRLSESDWLRSRVDLRAAIDLSDGLAGDTRHMAAASGTRIVIDSDSIPLHPGLERAADPQIALHMALTGGEDYELLLAIGSELPDSLAREFEAEFGLPITRIGSVESGEGVWLRQGTTTSALTLAGFDHLATGDS